MKWGLHSAHMGLKGFFNLNLHRNTYIKMQYVLNNTECEYLDIITVDSVVA